MVFLRTGAVNKVTKSKNGYFKTVILTFWPRVLKSAALTFNWLNLHCYRFWQPIQELSSSKPDELIKAIGFLVVVIYNRLYIFRSLPWEYSVNICGNKECSAIYYDGTWISWCIEWGTSRSDWTILIKTCIVLRCSTAIVIKNSVETTNFIGTLFRVTLQRHLSGYFGKWIGNNCKISEYFAISKDFINFLIRCNNIELIWFLIY